MLDILSGYATDTEGGAESSWEVESMRNFPRRPRLAHNPSGITMPLLEEGALLLGHDYITRPSLVIKEVMLSSFIYLSFSFFEETVLTGSMKLSMRYLLRPYCNVQSQEYNITSQVGAPHKAELQQKHFKASMILF